MKKSATKSRPSAESRKFQKEVEAADKEFLEKKAALDKQAAELEQLRRNQILKVVTGISLDTKELNILFSVFNKMPGNRDIGKRLADEARAEGVAMDKFGTKLIRMGLL